MNTTNHAKDTRPPPGKPLWQRVIDLERDTAALQARHTALRHQIQQLEQMVQRRTTFGNSLLSTMSMAQE